jgi:transposase
MYTDVELKIFSLSLLKGATDRFISEELGMSINFVKEVKEKLKKEIDSIVLTNDINGV